jgi:c-di-GMP-related signal transduction protein
VGLLSLVDSMLSRPLPDILGELGLGQEIEEALLGTESTPLGDLLRLTAAYERASWEEVERLTRRLALREEKLQASYLDSLKWSRQTLGAAT